MQENQSGKKHFALKAISTRPTFQQDMTDEERGIMEKHVAYWGDLANKGFVIVFGPVFDPAGGYGLGVVEVDNEEQVHTFIANDPAVISGLFKEEFYPMRAIMSKK